MSKKHNKRKQKNKRNMPTSKKALIFCFINCTVVELYSMVAMWHFADLSALYTLITSVVGQVITYAIYSAKSARENSVGGISYEAAMAEILSSAESEQNNTMAPVG